MSAEDFYTKWSDKDYNQILFDVQSSDRKYNAILDVLNDKFKFTSIVDYGCGYGKILNNACNNTVNSIGYGFDFSEKAIDFATNNFQTENIKFYQLCSLDVDSNIEFIKSKIDGKVDCVFLIDVLEHIPNCIKLIDVLSDITDFFVVKLPIEENILFNYLVNKEYPSATHSNGHLREFNVNNIHYFIRKLGLTPIVESVSIYDLEDAFPPIASNISRLMSIKRTVLKVITVLFRYVLPKKIFLRLIGNGTYCCIAKYERSNVLKP